MCQMEQLLTQIVKVFTTYLTSKDYISIDAKFIIENLLIISQFLSKFLEKRKKSEKENQNQIE